MFLRCGVHVERDVAGGSFCFQLLPECLLFQVFFSLALVHGGEETRIGFSPYPGTVQHGDRAHVLEFFEHGLAWRALRVRARFAVYPGQSLLDEEVPKITAVVGFDKGVVAAHGRTSRCESVTGMNGEWPGQDPFDVLGGLFAEAHNGTGVFEAEMVLLLADSLQFGIGAGGGFQAIHVVEPQVQFLAVGLDLETVAVVQASLDSSVAFSMVSSSAAGRAVARQHERNRTENRHFFITVVS